MIDFVAETARQFGLGKQVWLTAVGWVEDRYGLIERIEDTLPDDLQNSCTES